MKRRTPAPIAATDELRRRFLVRALSAGFIAGGAGWNWPALAVTLGRVPARLPEGRSIFEVKGSVHANGIPVTAQTLLKPTDTLRTGAGSYVIGAVGPDAFILRERSILEFGGGNPLKQAMRLVTGKLLGVFGRRGRDAALTIHSPTATIGIRGTGVYAEAYADRTYLCTCYGTTQLGATADAQAAETVTAQHHDAPRWILAKPENGKLIVPAGFQDHTDLELMTLEALVGRTVPFALPDTEYRGPRREY